MTAQSKNALENALALGRFSTLPRLPKTTWVDDVRRVIKREHGKGWRVEEQSGLIKLTYVGPPENGQIHCSAMDLSNFLG